MNNIEPAAIAATVSREVKEKLRKIARTHKRSLTQEVSHALELYVQKFEEASA